MFLVLRLYYSTKNDQFSVLHFNLPKNCFFIMFYSTKHLLYYKMDINKPIKMRHAQISITQRTSVKCAARETRRHSYR